MLQLSILFVYLSCFTNFNSNQIKREQDFNFGWKFSLTKDSTAYLKDYDDHDWRAVNLPHDWSIEAPFDTLHAEGCTGYLPGGMGWYRKHFETQHQQDQKVYLLFDGIYNHAEIWLNGLKLGKHHYGYSPFYFDLSPYLNPQGESNVIAVKVDRTRYADSRWYTGSGIYRNVKLITTNKLHIPIWGAFIQTPTINKDHAVIKIDLDLRNDFDEKKNISVITKILNDQNKVITEKNDSIILQEQTTKTFEQELQIQYPELWSIDHPVLYTATISIKSENKTLDTYTTNFGIRDFQFDADSGFFLNGKNMKIKGVCLHHDGGLVGAAVPKGVWRRRLKILKEGGCNAIRISHNPASEEFLALCDEMGFLVQDEFFDEWDYPKDKRLNMYERHDDYISRGSAAYFQDFAEEDLKNTVLAHRNHPSIFQWSIGNEIEWTYPRNRPATGFFDNMNWSGNYFWSQPPFTPQKIKSIYDSLPPQEYQIENTALKLSKWTKELDQSRPVIANCILPSASFETGLADAVDIVGFSYRRVMYDYAKKYYPNKVIMGTENVCQWHEWKAIMERPFVSGTFLWTGIDYMGEAHHRQANDLRRKGSTSGLLDLAGFKKPSYYMMKSLWDDKATLFVSTQNLKKSKYQIDEASGEVKEKKKDAWKRALWTWHEVNEHWNYELNEQIIVEIISNCTEVELFLNEKSLGVKKLEDFEDRIYKWVLPFKAGKLVAKGKLNHKKIITTLSTSYEPQFLNIEVDQTHLKADGYDVAHIIVQVQDKNHKPITNENELIEFEIEGDVKVMGVDNGHIQNFNHHQSNSIYTHKGRCILIIQSTTKEGVANITASTKKLKSKTIHIKTQK